MFHGGVAVCGCMCFCRVVYLCVFDVMLDSCVCLVRFIVLRVAACVLCTCGCVPVYYHVINVWCRFTLDTDDSRRKSATSRTGQQVTSRDRLFQPSTGRISGG